MISKVLRTEESQHSLLSCFNPYTRSCPLVHYPPSPLRYFPLRFLPSSPSLHPRTSSNCFDEPRPITLRAILRGATHLLLHIRTRLAVSSLSSARSPLSYLLERSYRISSHINGHSLILPSKARLSVIMSLLVERFKQIIRGD